MKILHIATGYPLSWQGGITNYVRLLALSQWNYGHDVWVLGGQDNSDYPFHYVSYKSKKIRPFTLGPLVDKVGIAEINRLLLLEKFDVIHIHMMLDVDWDLYKIIKNYKYVVSLHDYFSLCPRVIMMQPNHMLCKRYKKDNCKKCIQWVEQYRVLNAFFSKLDKYINIKKYLNIPQKTTETRYNKMKKLLEQASCLLPVSNRVKEIYEDSGINNSYRVLHIGNISADKYKNYSPSNEVRSSKINIAMLGSLNYFKGADLFLKFAERINKDKYNFHFYGNAGDYQEKIKKYNIINHGKYSQESLVSILNDIDIGFVLSVWEDNAPQVVMEFLNNNIPVVGTKMGGILDFVNEGNGYLFDPFSEIEFEKTVQFLNELTADKLEKMKKQITHTVTTKEHYTSLMNVYEQVIKING